MQLDDHTYTRTSTESTQQQQLSVDRASALLRARPPTNEPRHAPRATPNSRPHAHRTSHASTAQPPHCTHHALHAPHLCTSVGTLTPLTYVGPYLVGSQSTRSRSASTHSILPRACEPMLRLATGAARAGARTPRTSLSSVVGVGRPWPCLWPRPEGRGSLSPVSCYMVHGAAAGPTCRIFLERERSSA